MSRSEGKRVEFIHEELAQIRRLLDKATAELERGKLSEAQEALVAARHIYKQLAAQIVNWSGEYSEYSGDPQVFTLQLAQTDQAIARSERRLAAHMKNA